MSLLEGEEFAGYTIMRRLGAGGMGEVYLAQHPRLPRRDALKVLAASVSADPEYRERFIREADLASGLFHPNIVGVHDRGDFEGRLWIAMDYIAGTNAADLLTTHPLGIPVAQVADIASAVASALDYAHRQGLLHRDVKPANIMITDPDADGMRRVMLADFGIARNVGEISGLTATNMTVGTLAYSAPEQLMGLEDIDGRADQYALGATAYHLLAGTPLYPNSNPAVVISRHLNAAAPPLSATRPELAHLDAVLARALAKDPAERYPRCIDFARALSEDPDQSHTVGADPASAATQLAPVAPAPEPRSVVAVATGRTHRPRSAVVAGVAVVGVIAATAAAVALWPRASHPRTDESNGTGHSTSSAPESSPVLAGPISAPPAPVGASPSGPPGHGVDPASTGPTLGSSCTHAQFNATTVSSSGTIARCVSGGPDGDWWQPDSGDQIDPAIVGQGGWDACLKGYSQADCVRAAVAVAGGINPAGPVYPPGTYAVPSDIPYGTYAASIDFGTGQFNNGVAAIPCTYITYDASGKVIHAATVNSYSQPTPQVDIDQSTTRFQTSGCTPWAMTATR